MDSKLIRREAIPVYCSASNNVLLTNVISFTNICLIFSEIFRQRKRSKSKVKVQERKTDQDSNPESSNSSSAEAASASATTLDAN